MEIGDIVRFAAGPTALMRIDLISKNHDGRGIHRVYGTHCMGRSCGAYERDCTLATEDELEMWNKNAEWREQGSKSGVVVSANNEQTRYEDSIYNREHLSRRT